jgi:hypothetical protein
MKMVVIIKMERVVLMNLLDLMKEMEKRDMNN